MRSRALRPGVAATLLIDSVGVFLALMAVSAAVYPGGTSMDRHAPGFDPIRNFICDLASPVALNGERNLLGGAMATAAMLAMIAGLGLFWHVVPVLFPERVFLGQTIRRAGRISVVSLVLVPLTNWMPFGLLHVITICAAVAPALLAAEFAVLGLASPGLGTRGLAALGGATLMVALIDSVLYVSFVAIGGVPPLLLPALQRVATLLLAVWLVAVAARVRRLAAGSDGRPA